MPVSQDEAERRISACTEALRRHGLRITRQRLEVVREIASSDEHPDVETVFRQVRERVPNISLDTVYRTIGTLADLGVVIRVSSRAGASRYDARTSPHHHFICTRCGLIRDIESQRLDVLTPPPETSKVGHVDSVDVHFQGVCRDCAARAGA